jgi:deoxyribodipyrimidine photo-lyase
MFHPVSTSIHWFRRDLRISDNTSLNAAAKTERVVPVYIPSAWKAHHHWCGAHRQSFLCGSLASLHRNLEAKGGRLIVRSGLAVKVLLDLARESGATEIHTNRDPDPFGRAVEEDLAKAGAKHGVRVHLHQDHALHEHDELLTGDARPYRVFTPYARAWSKLPKPEPGRTLKRIHVPENIASEPLPTLAHWRLPATEPAIAPGEAAARKRLSRFLDGPVFAYGERRNLPSEEGTSRLSQDLRWGLLSIREVHAQWQEAAGTAKSVAHKNSAAVFLNELIWREFYLQVLWHTPEVLQHEYQPGTRRLAWRAHWRPEEDSAWDRDGSTREDFERWCQGRTGFPIVDAGMRQLAATGFMHNRVRMIVAMFLTKDLRLWWMHGESWFLRHLVDGEIASNNGGWQWSASTGTDAAPYFRIQNPWSQTKRFDPSGAYIQKWIPELRDVPAARFCEPAKLRLAKDYPLPMVDHGAARDRALELFKSSR